MIEIKDYDVVLQKSMYAKFTIYIPKFDMEIAQCKEFRLSNEKGERRWFAFPSYRKETLEGIKFFPIVKFGLQATEDHLWEEVKKEIDEYLIQHPEMDRKPQSFDSLEKELPF